ncbi:DNA-directed RNA polymerase subunit beta, partial [uncultured Eudoraea sp.]|uniref:DNA-directed RNA polymerase subunit beta n=1 Tax=uncultured Eudoraea sp. TaxID=1035614 RepID=UPI002625EB2B
IKSFQDFFQLETKSDERGNEGLYNTFMENFPITDTRNQFVLEFLDYFIDPPRYSIQECIERGLTYSVPLKARLKLYCTDPEHEDFETIVQDVYLGTIPYMTPSGTFVINGAERVVVSQLHRSPGVFFGQSFHANGTKLYSARVIPFKGSWIEFATDINSVMYAYIDRKKKLPVTTLFRAIGFERDKDILEIFDLSEEVKVSKTGLKKYLGRKLAARVLNTWHEDFVDEDTGEVVSIERNEIVLDRDTVLEKEHIDEIMEADVKTILLHKENNAQSDYAIIHNTLQKDPTNSEKEAVEHIYRQLRNAEPPDEETARGIIDKLFFSDQRYNLGEVGRYRMNKKLGLDIGMDKQVLTKEDIITIIKYLIELINSKAEIDDIDHLSNRRVRTVGEQLSSQFGVGLARMARTIRERMNVRDNEVFTPIDLINAKTLSSVINSFFGTNQLSQFMDQTNPLAEITHKRRLSALGPGGLSRERAGFEVRDVHYTHYGRLCPIETPEGPNIGLISSLAVFAKVNPMGFLETPYRKVGNGKVDTKDFVYLSAEEEEGMKISQANIPLKDNGAIDQEKVIAREEGDFPVVDPKEVNYTDVAPNQIASISASLIPFLEHDDANRALMGSNMMRQAVPLLKPQSPIVGTGLERQVASDSRVLINAEGDGVIEYVDSQKITINYKRSENEKLVSFEEDSKTYELVKFRKTNQGTSINLKPIVQKGDKVKKGQVLCEGYATEGGELALGRNLKVAFMPWKGYNFEDAIVISEKVVREDIFTSIHIDEYALEVRDTKLGAEELTNDIPNVSEEATKDLDEYGMIRIGAEVKPGDILIGKITPKGESDPTPEEKLLRAIFGDKAGDVKDASLKASPSLRGVVIDKKLFSRSIKDKRKRSEDKEAISSLELEYEVKFQELKEILVEKLFKLINGKTSQGVLNDLGEEVLPKGKKYTMKMLNSVDDFAHLVGGSWTTDKNTNVLVADLLHNYKIKLNDLQGNLRRDKFTISVGDELPAGIMKLAKVYIAKKRKLKVGDKMAGRHGNKGIVARIVRHEDMPFLEDGTPVDIVLNPLGVPSRMNIGQIYETVLGWAGQNLGKKFATPIFDGATLDEINEFTDEAGIPRFGHTYLYDGGTGQRFDQAATVGVIYMLKLGHMVDDKMHARSIGPYSLITQQPLGGKAQFGGQRFGEMEVWALEAYGASATLREILTVKSDDVIGRAKTYESIVKGETMPEPGLPESFNVLMHELKGLGLDIRLEE